jgi:plasmid stabilization system protein ParE
VYLAAALVEQMQNQSAWKRAEKKFRAACKKTLNEKPTLRDSSDNHPHKRHRIFALDTPKLLFGRRSDHLSVSRAHSEPIDRNRRDKTAKAAERHPDAWGGTLSSLLDYGRGPKSKRLPRRRLGAGHSGALLSSITNHTRRLTSTGQS